MSSKRKQDQPLELLGWDNLNSNPEARKTMVEGEGWRLLCLDLQANQMEAHRRLYLNDDTPKSNWQRGIIYAMDILLGLGDALKAKK